MDYAQSVFSESKVPQAKSVLGVFISFFFVSIGMAQDLSESKQPRMEFGTVKRGSFDILCSATGEAESAEKMEVKCETTAVVLAMVPEGTRVKPGDLLVKLSSTKLEEELGDQLMKIALVGTERVSAEARLRSASSALKEFEEVSYSQQEYALRQKMMVAGKRLEILQEEYAAAKDAGMTDFDFRKLAVQLEESKVEADLLSRQLELLQNVTKEAKTAELQGEIATATVAVANAQERYRILQSRLEHIEKQIQACTVLAPDGFEGEVYYAQLIAADGRAKPIEVGSQVYQGQTIAYVPASDKMNVIVHLGQAEAVRVQRQMPAILRILDRSHHGYVISMTPKRSGPSPSGDVRGLTGICTVRVIDPPYFQPGMSADVTIKVGEVRDKVYLPVQAVLNHDGHPYCCIQTPAGNHETRKLAVGRANGNFVEVIKGVAEGDRYLNHPGEWLEVLDLPSATGPFPDDDFNFPVPAVDQPSSRENRPGNAGSRGSPRGGAADSVGRGRPGAKNLQEAMQGAFGRYDINGDKVIDASELEKIAETPRRLLSVADANGDGKITEEELVKSSQKMIEQFQRREGPGGNKK